MTGGTVEELADINTNLDKFKNIIDERITGNDSNNNIIQTAVKNNQELVEKYKELYAKQKESQEIINKTSITLISFVAK